MTQEDHAIDHRIVTLSAGEQAVINGALIRVHDACTFDVGAGATIVLQGKMQQGKNGLRNPAEELYFSVLDCANDVIRFANARPRLFKMLSEVILREPDQDAQHECSECAAALAASNIEGVKRSATRLLAGRMRSNLALDEIPGSLGEAQ